MLVLLQLFVLVTSDVVSGDHTKRVDQWRTFYASISTMVSNHPFIHLPPGPAVRKHTAAGLPELDLGGGGNVTVDSLRDSAKLLATVQRALATRDPRVTRSSAKFEAME